MFFCSVHFLLEADFSHFVEVVFALEEKDEDQDYH